MEIAEKFVSTVGAQLLSLVSKDDREKAKTLLSLVILADRARWLEDGFNHTHREITDLSRGLL